jgi:nucleotidyltransferase/DNA polymerase involved in DNA repair
MILCLSIPFFAAAVEQRADSELGRQPLVVGGRHWEPRPVYAFSRQAARQGVRPGMSLRLAHTRCPGACFLPANQPCYLSAAGEVTDLLLDFTHLVEPESRWLPQAGRPVTAVDRVLPARYALELDSLPAAESLALAREIGRVVRQETHLAPAIGLAAGKFTAQVAAALARPNHTRPVVPGDEAGFLAQCSIRFLPLAAETVRRLGLLGIQTLGQLATLPLDQLQTQFGPDIVTCYRMARGEAAALPPLQAQPAIRQESAGHHFDDPVSDSQIVDNVLAHLAASLSARLQEAGLWVQNLHLAWETAGGQAGHLTAPLRQAADGEKRMAAVLREMAAQARPSWEAGLFSLSVRATNLAPVEARQLALFETAVPDNGLRTLTNLSGKHGPAAFLRPAALDRRHPLFERRFQLQAAV